MTVGKTFERSGKHHPLTSATVEIDGSCWGPKSTIWAGLRWHDAVFRASSIWSNDDPHLSVPFCHISDDMESEHCGWSRIRARDPEWKFVMAANGAWVLQKAANCSGFRSSTRS